MAAAGAAPGGSFFAGRARLEGRERDELLTGLAQLDDRLESAGVPELASRGLSWTARAAAVLAPEPGLDRPVGRSAWLDLVADLLEASTAVAAGSLALEALAMEGIAGRLLGVLLGDGPEEPALSDGR